MAGTKPAPPQKQEQQVIAYELKAEKATNSLHLTRKMTLAILLLEPKYYPALRGFFQVVRSGDEEQIVLQPGTASASN
jgi:hypothetical protein